MKFEVNTDLDYFVTLLNRIDMNLDSAIYNINRNELASAGIRINDAREARHEIYKILVEDSKEID